MSIKPRIRYSKEYSSWYCQGDDVIRYGDTPTQAYIRWRLITDAIKIYNAREQNK